MENPETEITNPKVFETSPDSKTWMKFPLLNGFIEFKVRSSSEARISLCPLPSDNKNMIEIYLGANNNQVSGIRQKVYEKKVRSKEVETKDILDSNEFKLFRIVWINSEVFVIEGNSKYAFLKMFYSRYAINYFGIYTVDSNGTWYIHDDERIETKMLTKYIYHGIRSGYIEVAYKGKSDAHIALLFLGQLTQAMCEISLGEKENSKSSIRIDNLKKPVVAEYTPNLLSEEKFTLFCIKWHKGTVSITKNSSDGPLIFSGENCVDFVVKFFALRSGHNATGNWILSINDDAKPILQPKPIDDSNPTINSNISNQLLE